jgi:hypothetical protein
MPEHHPVPGSCLCGGVRLELTPPFELASFCHCGNCRKHSGHAGSVAMKVPIEKMRIVSGEELIEHFQPGPGLAIRFFCRVCGSSLFGMNDVDSDEAWVRLGVLDADPGVRPSRHTWVGSAPAWLPVPDDGLPRYDRRPTG